VSQLRSATTVQKTLMKRNWQSRTKEDLVVEVWRHLSGDSVGARELKEIQSALKEQFGEGAVDSPAAIARVLADEGAELRHPEVVEYDASWREAKINQVKGKDTGELFDIENTWNLSKAAVWIKRLEAKRKEVKPDDRKQAKKLEERAREEKDRARVIAGSSAFSAIQRAEAAEIAEWLTIWLQQPAMFADWLDLRQRSPEFKRKLTE